MKRLAAIAASLLVLSGCGMPHSQTAPPPIRSLVTLPPHLKERSEMNELRRQVEYANESIDGAKQNYARECPDGWRNTPNPNIDQCETMSDYGKLVKRIKAAVNFCNKLVEDYNTQVQRGAENDGLIVPSVTKDSTGKVISCTDK